MKLNIHTPIIESSNDLQEKMFSIGDAGIVFDILRNKLYSNPILAVCREISCNARDAHREAGKGSEPIVIQLPTYLEQYYKIKDFGVGISPDRMDNIFIRYGSSTKRDTNELTGGMGLGCKSPMAVVDSFSIITIFDHVRYNYSCYIDETRVGKLALLSKTSTDDSNGTEIIIPVKESDFHLFKQYTEQACRHWEIKPIIKGGTIEWTKETKILEGTSWAIIKDDYYHRSCKMIIDGIEYPVNMSDLNKYAPTKMIDNIYGSIIMYWGNGELSLSANREQIYLDKQTQDKVKERLELIQSEIKDQVVKKVESFPNLYQAALYYQTDIKKIFGSTVFLGKMEYKDVEISDIAFKVECPVYSFNRRNAHWKSKTGKDSFDRTKCYSIYFSHKTDLYINDLGDFELTKKHVKKAFEDNKDLQCVQVVCPNATCTEAKLNQDVHLDMMEPKKLSSITSFSGSRKNVPASARLLVFKLATERETFRQTTYDALEEETLNKVLCKLHRFDNNNRMAVVSNNSKIDYRSMRTIQEKFSDFVFYGVDENTDAERIKNDLSDCEDFEKFLRRVVIPKDSNYLEMRLNNVNQCQNMNRLKDILTTIKPMITNTKSLFIQCLELQNQISKCDSKNFWQLNLYETVNGKIENEAVESYQKAHPELDLKTLNEKYKETYKLLTHVNGYYLLDNEEVKHIAHYVNCIDQQTMEN